MEQIPSIERVQRRTLSELESFLKDVRADYFVDSEGNKTSFVIYLPTTEQRQRQEVKKGLGTMELTSFDREVLAPLVRLIKTSSNLECTVERDSERVIVEVTTRN